VMRCDVAGDGEEEREGLVCRDRSMELGVARFDLRKREPRVLTAD
jgi:hypothetical protein